MEVSPSADSDRASSSHKGTQGCNPPADSGGDTLQEGASSNVERVGQRPLLEQALEYLELCQGAFTQTSAEQASAACDRIETDKVGAQLRADNSPVLRASGQLPQQL